MKRYAFPFLTNTNREHDTSNQEALLCGFREKLLEMITENKGK